VIVLTTGTGFATPPTGCEGCRDLLSAKTIPHVLQKAASSAFPLPQAEHCRMVETELDSVSEV
jgi:hypothetical protein